MKTLYVRVLKTIFAFAMLLPQSAPFLVVSWYRPPDTRVDIFNHFELLVGKLDATGREYFLVAYLNCRMISEIPDNDAQLLMNDYHRHLHVWSSSID